MKKTAMMLAVLFLLLTVPALGQIVLPEFNVPAETKLTLAELNIPADQIVAAFPAEVSLKYEGGVLSVPDIGAEKVVFRSYVDYVDLEMTLNNGVWSTETDLTKEEFDSDSYLVNISYNPVATDEHWWSLKYMDDVLTFVSVSTDDGTFVYEKGEYYCMYNLDGVRVTNYYDDGALTSEKVSSTFKGSTVEIVYNPEGTATKISVIKGSRVYYIPGKGWSKYTSPYQAVAAPAGFESLTEADLLAIAPWQMLKAPEAPEIPEIKQVVLPEFTIPKETMMSLSGLNLPLDAIDAAFPEEVPVLYGSGKIYVPDMGAMNMTFRSSADNISLQLKLEDGVWTGETSLTNGQFNGASYTLNVYSDRWNLGVNRDGYMYKVVNDADGSMVQFNKSSCTVTYRIGDTVVQNEYTGDSMDVHIVQSINPPGLFFDYNPDGSVMSIHVSADDVRYYILGKGWSESNIEYVPADAPAGFEDITEAQLFALAPRQFKVGPSEWDMVLPESVGTVGAEAFAGTSAVSVYIPDGAESIEDGAFAACPDLEWIRIPASVVDISTSAFSGSKVTVITPSVEIMKKFAEVSRVEVVIE